MGSTRRFATALVVVAALGAAMIGTAAVAQQDAAPPAVSDPTDLLARLGELEASLPDDVPPGAVTIDAETTWGVLDGDAGSVNAALDLLEEDLRQLFVDADESDGAVGDAVSVVARGWLDVWHGTAALASWESNDLVFPLATFDSNDVATGADELRGSAETGLTLVLQGRARHLEGYTALRELGAADAGAQALFDGRAAAAETFDTDMRPLLTRLLSKATTSVAVPTERFETSAPGVESRATSLTLVCVDRALISDTDGPLGGELLQELEAASAETIDCPDLALATDPADAP